MPIVSRRISIPAFHAVFDRWADLLDSYERLSGTGSDRDVAYWHYEDSLTGLLATAAWQNRGAGLVQFSTWRQYEKPEESGSGSGDAWLLVGGVWYAVEAKLCWTSSRIESYLEEAWAQLASLHREPTVTAGLAICYCAPYVPKGTSPVPSVKARASELEKRHADATFVIGYESINVNSPPEFEKYLYPGVVVLGQQAAWSRPPTERVDQSSTGASKIFVPAEAPVDWQPLLGDPDRHWRPGYSARALAHCWQSARDFPPSARRVLGSVDAGGFKDLTMLLAFPEYRIPLPPMTRAPSQADLFVLARAGEDLVAIAVEGKVTEPFGQTVAEWLSSSPSDGKVERLKYLCCELGLTEGAVGKIRYQLLHRAVGTLITARRFNARHAVMLVHSFSTENVGFEDYSRFSSFLGAEAKIDGIISAGERNGTHLHLAWVRGEEQYLWA